MAVPLNQMGFVVAGWSKVVLYPDRTLERQYCLRQDGTIITRYDRWDGPRLLTNVRTEGWQLHKFRRADETLVARLAVIEACLLPKGYVRNF